MKRQRIENAVEVIDYAIKNQVSVKEASVKCGLSDTYIKNVKADVYKSRKKGTISDTNYNMFETVYAKYRDGFVLQTTPQLVQSTPSKALEPNKPRDIPKTGNRESFKTDGNDADFEWVGSSNYSKDHVHTLDQLLKATQVDLDTWKVSRHEVNKWDVTMKILENGEWVAKTYQNWQVKAKLELDRKYIKEKAIGELFQEMTKEYVRPYKPLLMRDITDEKNLLEISIFDLHIGKLAWGGETFENYDVKIARKRFLGSIETLLRRAEGFDYERILFPIGNDFFNSDTMENTTTKGTPQDEDLRWQKTFDVGVRLLVDAIDMLREAGVPVDVVVIPGNHDFERSYYMGSYLSAWYKSDPHVSINNHASPRKYYRYGNTLLGLTHGSEEKEASLPMLMATDIESKPYWTDTKFHEWHVGHFHRKKIVTYDINKSRLLNEDLGITIRYLSSLTGTEEWHHKKGFVGSTKAEDAFIWNHEFGMIAHLNTNIILN